MAVIIRDFTDAEIEDFKSLTGETTSSKAVVQIVRAAISNNSDVFVELAYAKRQLAILEKELNDSRSKKTKIESLLKNLTKDIDALSGLIEAK